MTSRRERATEVTVPRRRPTPTRDDIRSSKSHTRGGAGGEGSFGSEAMSRHEMFVPTAYVVPPTVVVEPITAPAAGMNPHPPAPTELASSETGTREPEQSVYDESFYGSEQQIDQAPSSPSGTYSLYSRGISAAESERYDDGRGTGSHRHVGTRDFARHNDEASSRFTESSIGGGRDQDHEWSGPDGDPYDPERSGVASEYTDEDSRNSSGWTYKTNDKRAARRTAYDEPAPLPPYPFDQQKSDRSGMSHDLSGFSDFDSQQNGQKSKLFEDDPEYGEYRTPGAAAAAAAEATNAAAAEGKKRGNVVVSGSGRRRPYLAAKLPNPDSSAGDLGETKEEGDLSGSRISGVEEPSWFGRSGKSRGPRPEETAPSAGHGNTGEYAVVRYHAVVLTPFMFMVCAIILLYEFGLNDWKAESWSDNPSFGPSTATLIDAGAKRTDLIVEDGDWWRLVAPMFLHAGVIHFLFNMIGFMQVGTMVEKVFGWWKVALIYVVAGLFGTIVSAIFLPTQVMVGASGAIFGVFGALWADLWQNWSVYSEKCWALSVLLVLTVVNIVGGLMPYFDNFAHIGGLVMGFFMGLGLLVQKREDDFGSRLDKKCYQRTLQLVSAVAVPTLMILGLSLLYGRSDPEEWCGWCENLSCVEFPPSDPWWACDECSLTGFSVSVFDNGTTAMTCPDQSTVYTEACGGTTDELLTACCVDVCL